MSDVTTRALDILQRLGAGNPFDAVPDGSQRDLPATSPIDGHEIGRLASHSAADMKPSIESNMVMCL